MNRRDRQSPPDLILPNHVFNGAQCKKFSLQCQEG